jgi:hypothetical protein
MLPKEIHGQRSKKDHNVLALSSNKSSKAVSSAGCHSMPLFCKSRFVRFSDNFIFFLFIFLEVNVPTREYGPPPSPTITINEACSLY